ncbi:unnamed protein product [Danaus chrysippus]|uniref:(African queen) hypothetical protein n=1 Tax=Danaus chrysippus TaxID=151541 RepID=A0A8J2RBH6_9NEOP|nr:unnamed protein product [Danaus chrysippus]
MIAHGYMENSPAGLAFTASIACAGRGPAKQGKLLYNGVLDCLRKIYMTEGLAHGLYKGIGPLYLRIAVHLILPYPL